MTGELLLTKGGWKMRRCSPAFLVLVVCLAPAMAERIIVSDATPPAPDASSQPAQAISEQREEA